MKAGDLVYVWDKGKHGLIIKRIDYKGRVSILYSDGSTGEAYEANLSYLEEVPPEVINESR
tara:strand:+ start:181 stop:363 length:183 start_codon:yes stop_codon:yes gene_type:complete